jgi:putative spermidine/putrescine transport system permease protein
MERLTGISPFSRSLGWTIVIFLILPITIVVPVSLTDQRYLSFPKDHLSLQYYGKLFTSEAWLSSIGQSVAIALAATALAVVVGTQCAIGCWRVNTRATEIVRMLMLAPIIVPTIVYALGIYRFWISLKMLDTYLGVILAHGVTAIPYVVITVSTSLAGFDARLEQAARNLGASVGQTLRLVILPNIAAGVASGAIFAFVHSWDELVIVLFIASRNVFTLPRRIWDGIQDNIDPTMAAVAVVLVLVTIFLALVERALRGRRAA